jgi:DNA-binding winged helix-turn-helix (wHTH) protein
VRLPIPITSGSSNTCLALFLDEDSLSRVSGDSAPFEECVNDADRAMCEEETARNVLRVEIAADGADLARWRAQGAQLAIIIPPLASIPQTSAHSPSRLPDGSRVARFRVIERHANPAFRQKGTVSCGSMSIDLDSRKVTRDGLSVHLSRTEFRLLLSLLKTPGKVVSCKDLLRDTFGAEPAKREHHLRMYVRLLRLRIEQDPSRPRYVLTERNLGYRLALSDDDGA